ncbi:hypothetical protein [Pseudomonas weihenstephanensis]|uniref:hypothetical protein n=1 Tax=Pseudomonas weihenstephanensis TaxID=1608994 RepID=UPI00069D09D8|nr:hypothetical protein [Pseudomonas weihenstephanensis]
MITGRANLDLEALLHQPAFLAFNAQNGIHGQIERIARSGSETRLTHYSLTLVPHPAPDFPAPDGAADHRADA